MVKESHALDHSATETVKTFHVRTVSFSLQDILENDDVKLDSMFIASLIMDLIKVSKYQTREAITRHSGTLLVINGIVHV